MAAYTAKLLALGNLTSVVCTYGVIATSGRVDCWSAGKVTQ